MTALRIISGKSKPSNNASASPWTFPADRRICDTATQPRIVVPNGPATPTIKVGIRMASCHHSGPVEGPPGGVLLVRPTATNEKNVTGTQHAPTIAAREKRGGPEARSNSESGETPELRLRRTAVATVRKAAIPAKATMIRKGAAPFATRAEAAPTMRAIARTARTATKTPRQMMRRRPSRSSKSLNRLPDREAGLAVCATVFPPCTFSTCERNSAAVANLSSGVFSSARSTISSMRMSTCTRFEGGVMFSLGRSPVSIS